MKLHFLTKSCIHAAALISIGAMVAMTQPGDRPRQDRPRDGEQNAQHEEERPQRQGKKMLEIRINADALRARLNRSIARAEKMLKLHQSALTKLDEGASPTEVLAEMKIQGFARSAMSEQRGPGSGPRAGNDSPQGGPERMSPKNREEMHHFLQNNFPELWKNLEPIVKMNPQSADRLLARMSPQIREIMLLREAQPDLAALKIEEMHAGLMFVEASRLFRSTMSNASATDSDRADAMTNLQSAAAKRFDVQFKAKQHEITMLEARLEELKSSVEGIQDRREDAIERMLDGATRNQRGQAGHGGQGGRGPNSQNKSGND